MAEPGVSPLNAGVLIGKMEAREVGVESTAPCTWVKHLADLLRNKANSQQYPSVYEDRRPKSIEHTEKTDGKGIASGQ